MKQSGSFQNWQKGAQKRGKRVHWVIYEVFGNSLVLTGLQLYVQVEIHIRGLGVINELWYKHRWGVQLADRTRPLDGVEDKPSFLY